MSELTRPDPISNRAAKTPGGAPQLKRSTLIIVALLIVAAAIGLRGRQTGSSLAQQLAIREIRRAALAAAHDWLAWAAWCDPADGTTDLLAAFCYRHAARDDDWAAAIQRAADKGVPEQLVEREVGLQLAKAGALRDGSETALLETVADSVAEYDVLATLIEGSLTSRSYDRAERLLHAWNTSSSNDPHVLYMWGRYWNSRGETVQSREFLQQALELEPRHQLAGMSLAASFEEFDELQPALGHYIRLANAAPRAEPPVLGIARMLRKLGFLAGARETLAPWIDRPQPSPACAVEMGRIELESGNYEDAQSWLRQGDLEQTESLDLLASAIALAGNPQAAARYFAIASGERNRFVWSRDLQVRLAIEPGDTAAADLLQQLGSESGNRVAEQLAAIEDDPSAGGAPDPQRLFRQHCAACHGVEGRGDGPAARHLYPPPRDLRREPSRLVSTLSGAPTISDTAAVIRQGVPGTSMLPFAQFTDQEVMMLADEVHRLRRLGLAAELAELAELQDGEALSPDEIQRLIVQRTTPQGLVTPPEIDPPADDALRRGKQLYSTQGCVRCHGETGEGEPGTTWYDEKRRPHRPRDLAREPMKGGGSAEAIYLRIAVGMPGTPHPASRTLRESETVDLVHYCRSLAQGPHTSSTNYQRAMVATSEAYLDAVADQPGR